MNTRERLNFECIRIEYLLTLKDENENVRLPLMFK